ncbi:hypothetical protein ACFYNZ_09845 [Streptomyces kebangsaanensis]|uniref:Glycosyltransferase RgtA/B/C/D-like domain-containing protein n=1 Tax=Streptomyces kebangsaanensis TaxID=864058 RepID=A0ABW6KTN8_9ACTN
MDEHGVADVDDAPRNPLPARSGRPSAPSRLVRARAVLRRALPGLAVFAGMRLAVVAALSVWAVHIGRHPRTVLGMGWDSLWYIRIARHGYGTVLPGPAGSGVVYHDMAFFPLYPALIRAVNTVVPVGEVNVALALSWSAAVVAAAGIHAVGELLYGRRLAIALVALWAVLPQAVVATMAYTESLMTAFAAWALYAAFTRRWLTAGLLASLAGLTRPNGIAAAAAVLTALGLHVWRCRREGRPVGRRVWPAAVLAPAGWFGYVVWVGVKTGGPWGYFTVQRRFGSTFDFGHYTLHMFKHLVLAKASLGQYTAAAVAIGAVALFILSVLDRQPLPLLVYTATLMVMALGGAHFFTSRPRLLLPAFPLLLPVALTLSRARLRTVAVLMPALAAYSLVFGIYLTIVAKSPP